MPTKKLRKRCFLCLRRLIFENFTHAVRFRGHLRPICDNCFTNGMVSQDPGTLNIESPKNLQDPE